MKNIFLIYMILYLEYFLNLSGLNFLFSLMNFILFYLIDFIECTHVGYKVLTNLFGMLFPPGKAIKDIWKV